MHLKKIGLVFFDFPSFLPQLIFHHFNISLYLYPTSSRLLSQEETELLISKVMTPSLISSHGPNINKHRCECVCIIPCLHHVAVLNTLVCILFYLLSVQNLENQHVSVELITFISGSISLYGCIISLTDSLSFATVNYNFY